jgi:hypothetical protein
MFPTYMTGPLLLMGLRYGLTFKQQNLWRGLFKMQDFGRLMSPAAADGVEWCSLRYAFVVYVTRVA